MKKIEILKIKETPAEACEVVDLLDRNGVEWHSVGCNNWPEDYPYSPKAEFRIAFTSDAFLLNYRVVEETVRAQYGEDNEQVWTDSCMEFFLSPDKDSDVYYNLETNCIATVLLGVRGGDVEKSHASKQLLATIKRWSSLGRVPFEQHVAEGEWQTAFVVPFEVYWHHDLQSLMEENRCVMRANFYKCGDLLPKPHFLSWSPIDYEKPNFHLPRFFGEIIATNHTCKK